MKSLVKVLDITSALAVAGSISVCSASGVRLFIMMKFTICTPII